MPTQVENSEGSKIFQDNLIILLVFKVFSFFNRAYKGLIQCNIRELNKKENLQKLSRLNYSKNANRSTYSNNAHRKFLNLNSIYEEGSLVSNIVNDNLI